MKSKPDFFAAGMLAAVFAAYAAVYFGISREKTQENVPQINISWEDLSAFGHR
jgi:hypothetical protein